MPEIQVATQHSTCEVCGLRIEPCDLVIIAPGGVEIHEACS